MSLGIFPLHISTTHIGRIVSIIDTYATPNFWDGLQNYLSAKYLEISLRSCLVCLTQPKLTYPGTNCHSGENYFLVSNFFKEFFKSLPYIPLICMYNLLVALCSYCILVNDGRCSLMFYSLKRATKSCLFIHSSLTVSTWEELTDTDKIHLPSGSFIFCTAY